MAWTITRDLKFAHSLQVVFHVKVVRDVNELDSTHRRRRFWMAVAAIGAVQFAWHGATLTQTFVLDDFTWLACAARSRQSPGNIFTLEVSGFLRPVVHLAFLANYACCGMSAWGYYAVNVVLEIAGTVAFSALALRLTGSGVAAVCAAALFAGHHSHGEVVSWISARTSSLLAIWTLIAILAWLRWRASGRIRWWSLALTAFLLALLTKEEAVALLPILLVVDRLRGPDAATGSPRPRSWTWTLGSLAPFGVLLAAYLAMQLSVQSRNALVAAGDYEFGPSALARWLDRGSGLFVVKRAAASPWRELTLAALIAVGWFVLRRGPSALRRTALLGCVMSQLALLPTAGFTSHDASRYFYVASIGSSLAWAAVIAGAATALRPGRAVSLAIILAATATLLTHLHDQRRRTQSFRDRSEANHAIIAAARDMQSVWRTARESDAHLCFVHAPLGDIEMRGLLWLVGRVEGSRIHFAVGWPTDGACGVEDSIRITWNDEGRCFTPG